MAHKKAAGSAKNLSDSNPKYRGLKLSGGQFAHAGNIIIRQKGDVYQLWQNVYKGKDFTIHASIDGVISFRKKKFKRYDGRKYLRTVVDILPQKEHLKNKTQKLKKDVENKKIEEKSKPIKKTIAKKVTTKKTSTKVVNGDDLTKIEGIEPKIQEVLYQAGIMTFADLSTSKIADLRDILAKNDLSQHDPKTWKKQATLAKNGKWDDLKELQKELNGGK